jgi:RNA polymerase sigma-70 factor (ECF subfamily)
MEDSVPYDRLRLIFICCHPSLPVDAQVAMALREVCGLTTEQIAAAFRQRADDRAMDRSSESANQ